jgi:hypothetical protein
MLIVILKIEAIETMNATADPSANFRLVIVQTELERFKFLVRSLLRARMAKVCIMATTLLVFEADRYRPDRHISTSLPCTLPGLSNRTFTT